MVCFYCCDHFIYSPYVMNLDLETAKNEWDAVPTIVPHFKDCQPQDADKDKNESLQTPCIIPEEAALYLRSQELSFFMSRIEPTVTKRGISRLLSNLFGYPKLSSNLEPERNEVFAIAQCPLDPNNEIHNRMLQTVYKGLTGLHLDCPRHGRHWEQVGFQGSNPDTDLRGVGMLGLLHLVNLAASPQLAPLARAVECNKCESVTKVVLLYHAALFSLTLRLWQSHNCTINDCGNIMKQAAIQCKKKVEAAIQSLQDHVKKLSLPERCSPRARFVQAGSLHQLATQAQKEYFI
ncbi:hypothetical protein B566_EDAN017423 [Ephemera danica]|nr:hypothetical protein B566_EDAN017423 [Ephemera danica]